MKYFKVKLFFHRQFIIIILTSATFWNSIKTVTINCNYRIVSYESYEKNWVMANVYTCDDATVSEECDSTAEVVGVSNNQMPGRSRFDVRMLHFLRQRKMRAVPRKIGQFFPNLEVLRLPVLGLTEIHKEDFRGLRKLRFLYLGYNNFKILDGDLFKFTPNLEYLSIDHNPSLEHVGLGLLDSLPHLRILDAFKNKCIDLKGVHDGSTSALEKIKSELRTSCPPTQEMINNAESERIVNESFRKLLTGDGLDEAVEEVDMMSKDEIEEEADEVENASTHFDDDECQSKYSLENFHLNLMF